MHWDCNAYEEQTCAMLYKFFGIKLLMISIVVQCIRTALLISITVHCIGIALLMEQVVQCIGIALLGMYLKSLQCNSAVRILFCAIMFIISNCYAYSNLIVALH